MELTAHNIEIKAGRIDKWYNAYCDRVQTRVRNHDKYLAIVHQKLSCPFFLIFLVSHEPWFRQSQKNCHPGLSAPTVIWQQNMVVAPVWYVDSTVGNQDRNPNAAMGKNATIYDCYIFSFTLRIELFQKMSKT